MLLVFVGLAVTAALAPVVRRIMLQQGVVDVPNHRSSHSVPTPRGGGWACLVGAAAVALVVQLRGDDLPWLALAAALVMALVGFVDDRRDLPALVRLVAQALVGGAFGWTLGGLLMALVGAIAFPAVVNVVNFMDGINGITSVTMALWGVTTLVVGQTRDITGLTFLGAVSAGVALGFLPWNAPVARLFLGDVGSYLFGSLAAAGLLIAWANAAEVSLVVAAPLSIYALDTGCALVRRAARGEKLIESHREHVYQVLVHQHGLSHTAVSSIVATMAGIATLGWALLVWPAALALTGVLAATYLLLPSLIQLRANQRRTPAP